jgi:hypothetical protein
VAHNCPPLAIAGFAKADDDFSGGSGVPHEPALLRFVGRRSRDAPLGVGASTRKSCSAKSRAEEPRFGLAAAKHNDSYQGTALAVP